MGSWIAGIFVLVILGLAGLSVYRSRKNGKGCGCGCDGCSTCPPDREGRKPS